LGRGRKGEGAFTSRLNTGEGTGEREKWILKQLQKLDIRGKRFLGYHSYAHTCVEKGGLWKKTQGGRKRGGSKDSDFLGRGGARSCRPTSVFLTGGKTL